MVLQRSQARVRRAWRLGALEVGEQRVRELREAQEHETGDWSQRLKLINWVRPNDKDEDEGEGNGRGTGRQWRHFREQWRHFGDDGGTLEMMETIETLGDDGHWGQRGIYPVGIV